ncbi:MAG: hypothetical protein Kow00128_13800 [Deltaproteobacteria bacterium]
MRRRGTAGRVAALAAALLLLWAGRAPAAPKELVGKRAPSFTTRRVSGKPWSFSARRGGAPLLLTFWSIYCKACTEELSSLARLVAKRGPGSPEVIAVNEDGDVGLGRVKSFLEHFAAMPGSGPLPFPVLFDAKGEVAKQYGVSRLPTLIYIDAAGTVREAIEGFGPGKELAVAAAIDRLLAGGAPEALQEASAESTFDLEAVAPVCGVYRDGKWYRPLDLDESGRPEAVARARARGEEFLTRQAIRMALSDLGVTLRSEERIPECGVSYGMEIRMPAVPRDTLDLLLSRLSLPRILEVVSQETIERERDLLLYRRIRIHLPALADQMAAAGFDTREHLYRVRFVRASFPERRRFLDAVNGQFPYLSDLRPVSSPKGPPEYRLVAYASPDRVVRELKRLDVGTRNLSVEWLPGDILEVAMWR